MAKNLHLIANLNQNSPFFARIAGFVIQKPLFSKNDRRCTPRYSRCTPRYSRCTPRYIRKRLISGKASVFLIAHHLTIFVDF